MTEESQLTIEGAKTIIAEALVKMMAIKDTLFALGTELELMENAVDSVVEHLEAALEAFDDL